MRCEAKAFSPRKFVILGVFVFLYLVFAAQLALAETLLVNFTVAPYAMLELVTPNLAFPPVNPGDTVEATVQVLVRANVSWELRVLGSQAARTEDGAQIEVHSRIYAHDYVGYWEDISSVLTRVIVNHPPTTSEGVLVAIPLRLEGSFNDPPGTYQTQIELTLVPQV